MCISRPDKYAGDFVTIFEFIFFVGDRIDHLSDHQQNGWNFRGAMISNRLHGHDHFQVNPRRLLGGSLGALRIIRRLLTLAGQLVLGFEETRKLMGNTQQGREHGQRNTTDQIRV
jgi:hypothetical protein